MKVRIMRLLREKHRITCSELGRMLGVSPQRISQLETINIPNKSAMIVKLQKSFEDVIEARQAELSALTSDYLKHKDSLLEDVEETGYEL